MEKPKQLDQQMQKVLREPGSSAWRQYARLAVGRPSWPALLRYEILTGCFSGWPGAAGYALRRGVYRSLFGAMGRGVIIGGHVTLRGAERIFIGRGVAIDDHVVLDARDAGGRIDIEDGALISRNTIVRARNGRIRIGAGSDIGANCILATDQQLDIGRDVLVAAFSYLCAGGNHGVERTDVPMIQQGFVLKGGVVVEDDVWIGAHTMVMDGVRIGTGTIVGAHALVNADLPPWSVAWGQPARRRRSRKPEDATVP